MPEEQNVATKKWQRHHKSPAGLKVNQYFDATPQTVQRTTPQTLNLLLLLSFVCVQQIAEMIVENMAHHGVNMLRESVPVRFDRVEGSERVKATWKNVKTNEQSSQEYDTVLVATGK